MPVLLEGVLILILVKSFSMIGWTRSQKVLELRVARLVLLQLVSPSNIVQLHLDNMMEPDPPPYARKAFGYGVKSFPDSSQFSLLSG